jgi:hypothetical protein
VATECVRTIEADRCKESDRSAQQRQ